MPLGRDPATLTRQRLAIDVFLREHLGLSLRPPKTVLQRGTRGVGCLRRMIYRHHQLTRQRSLRALPRRPA